MSSKHSFDLPLYRARIPVPRPYITLMYRKPYRPPRSIPSPSLLPLPILYRFVFSSRPQDPCMKYTYIHFRLPQRPHRRLSLF